jgi:tetratricopeptide (TPR) repeat protein
MNDDANLAKAMRASTDLLQNEEYNKALELLDQALDAAMKSGERSNWIPTVCNHCALIADFAGRHNLTRRYYEQTLFYDSENARALYGLAKLLREAGEADLAKTYAAKCYDIVIRSTDRKWSGLLGLVTKGWPELSARS